jgi:hypothetical protein
MFSGRLQRLTLQCENLTWVSNRYVGNKGFQFYAELDVRRV